jgi:two-component system cell cycle response regulator DivK
VRTARDAKEAIAVLESFMPDLILMDIQLPDMDGLELTRRLKSDPATREIKIIAFSAHTTKADEEHIIAAGCDGYITKPIDTRTLTKTIAEYLK